MNEWVIQVNKGLIADKSSLFSDLHYCINEGNLMNMFSTV